jgi:PAS domain-containing protein
MRGGKASTTSPEKGHTPEGTTQPDGSLSGPEGHAGRDAGRDGFGGLPVVRYTARPGELTRSEYLDGDIHLLTGIDADEFREESRLWDRLIHADDRDEVHRRLLECYSEGNPIDVEYRIRTKSGEVRWVKDRGRLVKGTGGEPDRVEWASGLMHTMSTLSPAIILSLRR